MRKSSCKNKFFEDNFIAKRPFENICGNTRDRENHREISHRPGEKPVWVDRSIHQCHHSKLATTYSLHVTILPPRDLSSPLFLLSPSLMIKRETSQQGYRWIWLLHVVLEFRCHLSFCYMCRLQERARGYNAAFLLQCYYQRYIRGKLTWPWNTEYIRLWFRIPDVQTYNIFHTRHTRIRTYHTYFLYCCRENSFVWKFSWQISILQIRFF